MAWASRRMRAALSELARPRTVIPVHGETRHMQAHAQLAQSMGLASLVPHNGDVLRLSPGPVAIIDRVESGRLRVARGRRLQRVRAPKTDD